MIKIYSSDDRILIYHLKNILEADGVNCIVRNDQITSLVGEVPAQECWPELWLLNEAQSTIAGELISATLAQPGGSASRWTCAGCREEHEPQFALCWNCGASRDDVAD